MNKVLNKVAALRDHELFEVLHFLNITTVNEYEAGSLRAKLMNAFSTNEASPKVFADMWQSQVNQLFKQYADAHNWIFQMIGINKPCEHDDDFNNFYLHHLVRTKVIEPFSLLAHWNLSSELLKHDMMDFYDVSAEPHHKVEYSLQFFRGDFSGVGEFAYIPESLVVSCESVENAFTVVTGHHPRHIICTYDDERVDANGNEYVEGAYFIQNLEVGKVVYWNHPDRALSSGKYIVVAIDSVDDIILDETIIRLINAAGGEAEVYQNVRKAPSFRSVMNSTDNETARVFA